MKTKFPKTQKAEKERFSIIINRLKEIYPDIKIQLDFTNPFELLIATILSAQCTDARVNIVTKSLFKKYLTPYDYLKVPVEELEKDIFSTGFYKAKAKNIRGACRKIISDFDGNVPDKMDDLLTLPGVGRKTANVVLGHCFNTPGIVVDTHVTRISNLLGFTDTNDAVKIEYKLMKILPKEVWVTFTHYFINHGRNTCIARRPKCSECVVSDLCPSAVNNFNN
ncbi:MAG: endonuclease III [Candidatus Kapabacteria bacterium]|nr:endonuclease III [Ignavibacteriota bacterium]MCW5885450.1 endonuclease III [Candidatus Kapabacteria bacterium]